jgi:hypothetical protein
MKIKDAVEFLEEGMDVIGSLVGGKFGQVEHEIVAAVRGVTDAFAGFQAGTLTLVEARAAIAKSRSELRDDLAAGDLAADEDAARLPKRGKK